MHLNELSTVGIYRRILAAVGDVSSEETMQRPPQPHGPLWPRWYATVMRLWLRLSLVTRAAGIPKVVENNDAFVAILNTNVLPSASETNNT